MKGIPESFRKRFSELLETVMQPTEFTGKKAQTTVLFTMDTDLPRIILLGLGPKEKCTIRSWKQAIGASAIVAQQKKMTALSVFLPHDVVKQFGARRLAEASVVALEVAQYAYDDHRTDKDAKVQPLGGVTFVGDFGSAEKRLLQKGADDGRVIGESMNITRHLGNTPPSMMTPTILAKETQVMAKGIPRLSVKVLSQPQIEKLKMGCFLGVARGSAEEPKFIIMEYKGGSEKQAPIVLVGKGITFDSGGISLKPGDYLCDMKFDMLGGATVIGTIRAAAKLGIKKNIVGLVPACENMPGGNAYRPDDILIAMDGKSVLIENTDAEGRLILADALCYAERYHPKEVIDLATLTGHCLVALGNERSGLFSPDEELADRLLESAENTGEHVWRLPLGEEFSDAIKCEIADLKNAGGVGGPRYGGASIGAAFLQAFTNYPWAHIDMASAYSSHKAKPWIRVGANGFGVEMLLDYLRA